MSRRKEVYARLACQIRHHDRPAQAELECPGAMGMYAYLLAQARGEESDGDVLEAVALASWGASSTKMIAYRRKQVEALLRAGLVERRGNRLVVVRYADHNDDRETIAANREAARASKREERASKTAPKFVDDSSSLDRLSEDAPEESRVVTSNVQKDNARTTDGTTPVVPISLSISPSLGSSGSDPDQPDRSGARAREVPPWFVAAAATAELAVGVAPDDLPARYLEYAASRERKGYSPGQRDAAGWLTAVLRRERRDRVERRPGLRVVQPLIDRDADWIHVGGGSL